MRSINLCEKLYKDNIKVELISSVFDHTKKIHRKKPFYIKNNLLRETYLLKVLVINLISVLEDYLIIV